MRWLDCLAAIVDKPLCVGTVVQSYKIQKVLGMGSYGFSYVVTDDSSEKKVLKQLRKIKQWSKSGRDSFEYEKEILQHLHHKGIPKLFDFFEWRGHSCIIMEHMQGITFEELIFDQHVTFLEHEVFEIIQKVLHIVSYIHNLGIIHRDLRIPNILYNNESVSIIDFGLARFMNECTYREAECRDEKSLMRECHVRSDFYALGHFMLFLLYSGYQPTQKEERPWFEELSLSKQGRSILERMLQMKEPYNHAEELMKDISALIV